jgi:hypothetical protein
MPEVSDGLVAVLAADSSRRLNRRVRPISDFRWLS